jgi:hypothetical protein
MPCEPLCTGYGPCKTGFHRLKFITYMVREADQLARKLGNRLPADYPLALGDSTLSVLSEKRAQYARTAR